MTVRYESEWVSDERRNMHLSRKQGIENLENDVHFIAGWDTNEHVFVRVDLTPFMENDE